MPCSFVLTSFYQHSSQRHTPIKFAKFIILKYKMQQTPQPSKKLQEFRVAIRDRNRKTRTNVQRSQAITSLTLTQQQLTSLKSTLTPDTLPQHLTQLKYLSFNTQQLCNFISLISPLLRLAKQTKQDWVYIDSMTILTNMVICGNFQYDEELALGMAGFLLDQRKEMEIMELYSNLLNFGGHKLFQGLVDMELINFLESRQKKKFEDQKKMTAFIDLMFASLAYYNQLKQDKLKQLIKIILQSQDTIPPPQMQWQVCAKLSRFYRQIDVTHALIVIDGFRSILQTVFTFKKPKPLMWLSGFLTQLAKMPKGITIYKQMGLFTLFSKALQTKNPQTKQLLITILSQMAGLPQSKTQSLFLHIVSLTKSFQSQPPPIQLSLAFFLTNLLVNSQDPSSLPMLKDFGLLTHIKYLLESASVEMINSGLTLLAAVLGVNPKYAKLCEEQNIHVVLFHLQQHPLIQVYQRSYALIDMYFKVE